MTIRNLQFLFRPKALALIGVPELVELDINPLFADAEGIIALDARARVARSALPHGTRGKD